MPYDEDEEYDDEYEAECQNCGYFYDSSESASCPECGYLHADDSADRYSTDVLRASGYSFERRPPSSRLRMGFELECCGHNRSPSELARDPLNEAFAELRSEFPFANKYCITKSDASIHGPRPAELVTIPLTVEEHSKVLYRAFPEGRVGGRGLACWSNSTCGFHIHAPVYEAGQQYRADGSLSPLSLTRLVISKMLLFVNDPFNERFWIDIAGRGANTYAQFRRASISDYQKFLTGNMETEINGRTHRVKEFNKYDALNVIPGRTIEFRLPRPSARIKSILKNLELYESSLCWVKLHSAADPLSYRGYLQWLAVPRRRKEFTHLHAWLAGRDSKYGEIYRSYL